MAPGTIKIKFCGLGRPEEVRWAEELKADFVGFNLYPESPRYVSPARLRKLAGEVKTAQKVLVFVNSGLKEIVQAAKESGADVIQLHGDENPEFCSAVKSATGLPVIKAFRLATEKDLKPLKEYLKSTDYFLLDARSGSLYGGTGKSFSWNLAVKAKKLGKPVFLAGGLTGENVSAACKKAVPFAVDVAGGVERTAGVKSKKKMVIFAQKVRNNDIL